MLYVVNLAVAVVEQDVVKFIVVTQGPQLKLNIDILFTKCFKRILFLIVSVPGECDCYHFIF